MRLQATHVSPVQGVEIIQEVAAVSPQEYERQQKDDLASSGGVRNVAKFVESLADRQVSFTGSPHAALSNEPVTTIMKRNSNTGNVLCMCILHF